MLFWAEVCDFRSLVRPEFQAFRCSRTMFFLGEPQPRHPRQVGCVGGGTAALPGPLTPIGRCRVYGTGLADCPERPGLRVHL